MGKKQKDAPHVLARMSVQDLPRVYVLGCGAKRVTVLSQQYRAFNLIWALFAHGLLKEGDRVGVIGGGIGGLSVAAAAMLKGCQVVLAEERPDLMHLQRGNSTRLLHPNIYEWPLRGSEVEQTRFPCMNWSADFAGQVVARLDEEWRALDAEYHPTVRTTTRITGIEAQGSEGLLVLKSENWESDPCHVVVAAVGFGVEPTVTGLNLDSYWENDKVAQPVRSPYTMKRFLVSGLGDGACIDVLRLKYSNFDHAVFAAKVTRLQCLAKVKRRLLQIDLKVPDTGQAAYLAAEYGKLSFPADLASQLGNLRTDTHVVLNGPEPAPLSPGACILHRVAIWALLMASHLEYRPGRIDVDAIEPTKSTNGFKYKVPLPGGGGKDFFDGLVMRHGPRSCLQALPEIARRYRRITEHPAKDRTRSQCYPDDFFPLRGSRTGPDKARASSSVSRTLAEGLRVGETQSPSLVSGGMSINSGGPTVRLQETPSSIPSPEQRVGELEVLVRVLGTETRAQNYIQAAEAARQLEVLVTTHGDALAPGLWDAAHKALWDYELYVRERVEATGETYDLNRLRLLIKRMERA